MQMTSYRARDHPEEPNMRFYSIHARNGGMVDVYLTPSPGTHLIVCGVYPWDGMEDDIRLRYEAWCESAEPIKI